MSSCYCEEVKRGLVMFYRVKVAAKGKVDT
jgi:hypothetical protein